MIAVLGRTSKSYRLSVIETRALPPMATNSQADTSQPFHRPSMILPSLNGTSKTLLSNHSERFLSGKREPRPGEAATKVLLEHSIPTEHLRTLLLRREVHPLHLTRPRRPRQVRMEDCYLHQRQISNKANRQIRRNDFMACLLLPGIV